MIIERIRSTKKQREKEKLKRHRRRHFKFSKLAYCVELKSDGVEVVVTRACQDRNNPSEVLSPKVALHFYDCDTLNGNGDDDVGPLYGSPNNIRLDMDGLDKLIDTLQKAREKLAEALVESLIIEPITEGQDNS